MDTLMTYGLVSVFEGKYVQDALAAHFGSLHLF